jgi:hypothetical protein
MCLEDLETLCEAVLSRRDLTLEDRKFWKERLAWVEKQKTEVC